MNVSGSSYPFTKKMCAVRFAYHVFVSHDVFKEANNVTRYQNQLVHVRAIFARRIKVYIYTYTHHLSIANMHVCVCVCVDVQYSGRKAQAAHLVYSLPHRSNIACTFHAESIQRALPF